MFVSPCAVLYAKPHATSFCNTASQLFFSHLVFVASLITTEAIEFLSLKSFQRRNLLLIRREKSTVWETTQREVNVNEETLELARW